MIDIVRGPILLYRCIFMQGNIMRFIYGSMVFLLIPFLVVSCSKKEQPLPESVEVEEIQEVVTDNPYFTEQLEKANLGDVEAQTNGHIL